MSHARNERQPSTEDAANSFHDVDPTKYQSMRGCLTLTAILIICVVIAVAMTLIFGSPGH